MLELSFQSFNFTLNNVGDFYSPPFRYFDLGDEFIDIKASKLQNTKGKKLIIGGGALTNQVEKLKLNKTLKSNYVITWGVGGDKRVTKDEILEFQENEDHIGKLLKVRVCSLCIMYAQKL